MQKLREPAGKEVASEREREGERDSDSGRESRQGQTVTPAWLDSQAREAEVIDSAERPVSGFGARGPLTRQRDSPLSCAPGHGALRSCFVTSPCSQEDRVLFPHQREQ